MAQSFEHLREFIAATNQDLTNQEIDPIQNLKNIREKLKRVEIEKESTIMEYKKRLEELAAEKDMEIELKTSEIEIKLRKTLMQLTTNHQEEVKKLISRNNILKEKLLKKVHLSESMIVLKKENMEKDSIVKVKSDTIANLKSQVKLKELEVGQMRDAIVNFQKAMELKKIHEGRRAK
jgi:hypothetical protein